MAYQEQQAERKRMVVETPNVQRESVHSEVVRYPERSGVSGGAIAAIIIAVVGAAAIVVLFVMNRQQDTANNAASQSPPTTVVEQPAQQPPVIVQQPAPATQPAPVIVNNQPATASGSGSSAPDDATVQAAIDKKLSTDPNLSSLAVVASVASGKVTLTGSVRDEVQKAQVERAVRNIKGVKSIDNQITVR